MKTAGRKGCAACASAAPAPAQDGRAGIRRPAPVTALGNLEAQDLFRRGGLAEAHVASHAAPVSGPLTAQRQCPACEREDDQRVQRKARDDAPDYAPRIVSEVLRAPGRPLDTSIRSHFEPRVGKALDHVRVHTDDRAARSARAVGAHAYTVGSQMVFGSGEYAPGTEDGRRLVAHELTHVLQQARARPPAPGAGLRVDDSGEREAHAAGEAMDLGRPATPLPSQAVQRQRLMPRAGPGRLGPGAQPRVTPRPVPAEPTPAPWWQQIPVPEPLPPVYPVPETSPRPEPQPVPDEDERRRDPQCGDPEMPLTHVEFFPGPFGQGGRVKASPLTKCPGNTVGTLPHPSIYRTEFECIADADETYHWVRAHLLHGRTSSSGPFNLHGPGDDIRNLIITDKALNGAMSRQAETPALNLIYGLNQVLWYEANVDSYYPGLDAFANTVTVRFGFYNPLTRTEHPPFGGGTFALSRTPPNCPSLMSTLLPAPVGGAAAGMTPTEELAFMSTLQICREELESRNFRVSDGGVMVRIHAEWVDAQGEPASSTDCPSRTFEIQLERSRSYWWDESIGTQEVEVGKEQRVGWQCLRSGDYYLRIISPDPRSDCCLEGTITVTTMDTTWECTPEELKA